MTATSRPASTATRDELDVVTRPWRQQRARIALVPTMGNLHAGHLQLCEQARQRADRVIVTIFVNPTQFGPGEDFDAYPRTLDDDLAALHEIDCVDAVFIPEVGEIYPHGTDLATQLRLPALSRELCGATRPGHFDGVAGVVLRLLNLTAPDVLILGEKDYQQLVLIRWLLTDLCIDIEVAGMPITRTADGLALSSRNIYLSNSERDRAPTLHRELEAVSAAIRAGSLDFGELESQAEQALRNSGFAVDYVAVRNALDLSVPDTGERDAELIVLGAAALGKARLIDNIRV